METPKANELKEKLGVVFDKIGTLTRVQRLAICLITFAAIGGAYYYFIFMPKNDQLVLVKNTYNTQVEMLSTYQKRASEIVQYEKKMAETQKAFNEAMKALPDKREIPSLLTGISNAGSSAGLDFILFQPDNEQNKTFYTEIPVSVKVEGRYHQVTDFLFQIARLNRIVSINDVEVKSKQEGQRLEMSCKAVTYMFVEEPDPAVKGKKNQANTKG